MFGKTEELIIVLLIVMLLFGAKRIPQIARSIGQSAKEVRKGFQDGMEDDSSKKTNKTSEK